MALDRKEVQARGVNLHKALQSSAPAASVVSLLKELQKGVRPTEELLRSTQIGKTVNRCKQHKTKEVSDLAAEIVSKWRRQVHEQKQSNGGNSGAGTPNPRANGTTSPAPKLNQEPTVPLDKRSWQTDDLKKSDLCHESTRSNATGLMYNGLSQHSSNPSSHILECAKAIETAAMNLPGVDNSTSETYKDKIRSLYQNLRNKANPELKIRVLNGEVSGEQLVLMSPDALLSNRQKKEVEAIEKDNLHKAMVAKEAKSVSRSLQCGRCGQKKVSYSQAQTRSADEPMTTFCECTVCGNRWKFS